MKQLGKDVETVDSMNEFEFDSVAEVERWEWSGNHWQDHQAFCACARLIKRLAYAGDRESAKRVIFLFGKFGMGIDDEITDEILDNELENDW